MTHPLHNAWRDSEATEAASDALNRALTQGDEATNQRAREMREHRPGERLQSIAARESGEAATAERTAIGQAIRQLMGRLMQRGQV